jgi:hypothetical protein
LVVFGKFRKKGSGKRGMSPVVSTVIMTGAMVAILGVALVFANNLLWSRVAEGDFESSKQLMQSIGLQIDDVAWTIGRTETIRYATQYGDIEFEPDVLTYTVTVNGVPEQYETGILMFNIPTSRYSISDDYWAKIFPETDENLTLKGTSAPVARVFAVESTPMPDGKYIRVVVAPSIRVLYSNITTGNPPTTTTTHYVRMYLPILNLADSPRLSQSITLTGESLNSFTRNNVDSINVTVSFLGAGSGFNSTFFRFPGDNPENFDFTEYTEYDNVVLELYVSEVAVAFGVS